MNKTKTIYQQWVRCKRTDCRKCPHGPYWYANWVDNGRRFHKYLGKVLKDEWLVEYNRQKSRKSSKV